MRPLAKRAIREILLAAVGVGLGLGAMAVVTRKVHVARWMSPRLWADPAAIALAVALGLAVFAPVRAILVACRRQAPARAIVPLASLGALAAAVAGGAAWWRVERLRAEVIAQRPWQLGDAADREMWAVGIAGAGIWVAVVLWAVAAVLHARRHARRSPMAAAAMAGIVISGVAAEGVARSAYGILTFRGWSGCGYGGFGWFRMLYEGTEEAGAHLLSMRLWVLVAAGLGSVAVLALARRAPPAPRPSRRALAVAGGVFAVGLAAVALNWQKGADARRPPPLWEVDAKLDMELRPAVVAALPRAGACDHFLVDWPLVSLEADGKWWVDGIGAADIKELAKILGAKRALWRQIVPNRPFPGRFGAALPADAPYARVRQLLDAARDEGYTWVDALEVIPEEASHTRTLGDVPFLPRACTVTIDTRHVYPAAATWLALLRATEH